MKARVSGDRLTLVPVGAVDSAGGSLSGRDFPLEVEIIGGAEFGRSRYSSSSRRRSSACVDNVPALWTQL